MRRKKSYRSWLMNYLIYGYGASLLSMLIVKIYFPEASMTKLQFFLLAPVATSIFAFPIFYYFKVQILDLSKVYKEGSLGVKIFLIIGMLGVVYRAYWDYTRTEKAKIQREEKLNKISQK